jgi:hypothetical protein
MTELHEPAMPSFREEQEIGLQRGVMNDQVGKFDV